MPRLRQRPVSTGPARRRPRSTNSEGTYSMSKKQKISRELVLAGDERSVNQLARFSRALDQRVVKELVREENRYLLHDERVRLMITAGERDAVGLVGMHDKFVDLVRGEAG